MSPTTLGAGVWELPPLILCPFSGHLLPATLVESSRAALMLSGLLPSDGSEPEDLKQQLMAGRYAEIRMLFFLGKDLARWMEQCEEFVERSAELRGEQIYAQSFAALLIEDPPGAVKSKLAAWGVADYASIFARAIGLHALFTEPPPVDTLSADFLRAYHRFADAMFRCYLGLQPHRKIGSSNFRFDLYASGEYSRMLEAEWGAI